MKKHSFITSTDLFCGAGGSSSGARAAGVEISVALNHWPLAIETHNTNFPNARHECTDISASDPRRYPSTTILIASPECFPAGTMIMTMLGLKPIEEINIGEMVYTHMNRWRPVVRTQNSVSDTIIVKGQGHSLGIEVTPSHKFWLREQTKIWDNELRDYNRHIHLEPEWMPITDATQKKLRWATPTEWTGITPPTPPVALGANPEIAWWCVGNWLGNGSIATSRKENAVTISCGKHNRERIASALALTGRKWSEHEKRTAINFTTWDKELHDWLYHHFGAGAKNKSIHPSVLTLPIEQRRALLNGYAEADGHRSKRRTYTCTVSNKLAISIKFLAESIGYRASLSRYEQHTNTIEGRTVNTSPIYTVAWENNASARAAFEDGGKAWSLIKKIEPGRQSITVYNLEVEEDHSYIANGIVVANCTNHTLAKGIKRNRQPGWFDGPIDPSAERSRATMWDVVRFSEYHNYELVYVENVVDAAKWLPFDSWLHAMDSLGYNHRIVYLNSMFAHPTPQSRDRMYGVFWKKKNKAPNLDIHPAGFCQHCQAEVATVQVWKKSTPWGKYGQQYIYCCPKCSKEVKPYFHPASEAIDWSLPIQRIGDRDRPLKEKTLARIRIGLAKYGPQFMMDAIHTARDAGESMVFPFTNPMRTQMSQVTHGLVVGLSHSGEGADRSRSTSEPMATQTSRQDMALLTTPFIANLYGTSTVSSLDEPVGTQTSVPHQALIVPYYNTGVAGPVSEALPTVTAVDRHGLLTTPQDFILGYYTRTSGQQAALSGIDEAMPTQSSQPRHYLVHPEINIDDCGFRMFRSKEVGKAMAFEEKYIVKGTERERVRQFGLAVTPPVMKMLVSRGVESLS